MHNRIKNYIQVNSIGFIENIYIQVFANGKIIMQNMVKNYIYSMIFIDNFNIQNFANGKINLGHSKNEKLLILH